MRRISLAFALLSAVAAGCGQTSLAPQNGGAPGVAEGTFTITIQNGQGQVRNLVTNVLPLEMLGGTVTSVPEGINCAAGSLDGCSASFSKDTVVVLTATAAGTDPAYALPYVFQGWAGDCSGLGTCSLSGNVDRYVVASFAGKRTSHPNFSDGATHAAAFDAQATNGLDCKSCHGQLLQGQNIAVACDTCHTNPDAAGATLQATRERCGSCHATTGSHHQAQYNKFTDAPTLVAAIESVVSTPNAGTTPQTFKSVVTFNLKKGGAPYGDATLSGLAQKRYMGTKYDPATRTFETASAISYGSLKSLGGGRYTVEAAAAKFAPEASSSFIYFYFAEPSTIVPPVAGGHYNLYENVASVAKAYGTLDFVSAAPSRNCEKCHGAPYQKHGYRAGFVAGVPDMVPCKACHHDQRVGSHKDWQCLAEDPAAYAGGTCDTKPEWTPQYDYVASTMNDTHMSHAMEFAYPQSMANCVTCHENPAQPGKVMTNFLTDANMKLATCKSCHPVTATTASTGAPPLTPAIGTAPAVGFKQGVLPAHHSASLMFGMDCNGCHADNALSIDPATHVVTYGGAVDGVGPFFDFGTGPVYVPLFKEIHNGYDHRIYADAAGTKFSSSIKASITAASFNSATKKLSVSFKVDGAAADALIKPTVVISLYGYDTKDFIVGGHASQPAPDGKRNLEWAEAASGNSPRLTVTPAVATAGNVTWTAEADLTLWAAYLADGRVKRAEVGILPVMGLAQNAAVSDTNPEIAVAGVSKTFDLVGNALVADAEAYGRNITNTAKCNKCHEALAIEFHHPAYGSAGVVGCRLCHVVGSGGSHLEMQSRSIDSYVHSIHSMQPFDIGDIDFADPVAAMRYSHHTESTYPNFTTLNCESCHNPGTYNAPANDKSLPGILSAADAVTTKTRAIGGVSSAVVGPGSRACGGCHRAELVNEDDAAGLAAFDAHTSDTWGGYREEPGTATTLDVIIAKLKAFFE
jgi:OmcA/MtrC family decaheme c-type cytochrome